MKKVADTFILKQIIAVWVLVFMILAGIGGTLIENPEILRVFLVSAAAVWLHAAITSFMCIYVK